jgi:hypothetical protein
VRTSGDTDYTYVKMVFDSAQLKLPECPSEEKLAELGLITPPAPGAAAGTKGAGAKSAPGAGKVPFGGPAGSGAAAAQGAAPVPEPPPIKTLGDSKLAAAIAALTASQDPPPRPEAAINARRLAEAAVTPAVGASIAAPAAAPAATSAAPKPKPAAPRAQNLIRPRPATPRAQPAAAPAIGPLTPLVGANGRDPFAGLVSKPTATRDGSVYVVTDPSPQEAYSAGTSPTLTLTFFFGMSANKTFAYGKGNSISVPADGLKFNIEAANWWARARHSGRGAHGQAAACRGAPWGRGGPVHFSRLAAVQRDRLALPHASHPNPQPSSPRPRSTPPRTGPSARRSTACASTSPLPPTCRTRRRRSSRWTRCVSGGEGRRRRRRLAAAASVSLQQRGSRLLAPPRNPPLPHPPSPPPPHP